MKTVIDEIHVKSVGDTAWELTDSFEYKNIIVPSGFKTDFASIPIPFRNFINPTGKIKPAAIVHDYLYHLRGKYMDEDYSRKDCDKIFLEIMEAIGMSWIKRRAAYTAVRSFGWIFWNKKD